MPHAKTLEREANVKRVLDVALECFYQSGIERTKIADIAERAGVTSMSVHRYFGDKANLVINTYRLFWFRLSKKLHGGLSGDAAAGQTGLEQAAALLESYAKLYLKDPKMFAQMRNFENFLRNQAPASIRELEEFSFAFPVDSVPLLNAIRAGQADGSIQSRVAANELLELSLTSLFGAMGQLSASDGQGGKA